MHQGVCQTGTRLYSQAQREDRNHRKRVRRPNPHRHDRRTIRRITYNQPKRLHKSTHLHSKQRKTIYQIPRQPRQRRTPTHKRECMEIQLWYPTRTPDFYNCSRYDDMWYKDIDSKHAFEKQMRKHIGPHFEEVMRCIESHARQGGRLLRLRAFGPQRSKHCDDHCWTLRNTGPTHIPSRLRRSNVYRYTAFANRMSESSHCVCCVPVASISYQAEVMTIPLSDNLDHVVAKMTNPNTTTYLIVYLFGDPGALVCLTNNAEEKSRVERICTSCKIIDVATLNAHEELVTYIGMGFTLDARGKVFEIAQFAKKLTQQQFYSFYSALVGWEGLEKAVGPYHTFFQHPSQAQCIRLYETLRTNLPL